MHRISVLAFDHVVPSDLALPADLFPAVEVKGVPKPYELKVCSQRRRIRTGFFDIMTSHGLSELPNADTIIVPGIPSLQKMPSAPLLDALREAAARGTRIASICTGAAILAEAGILDGLQATAHWAMVPELIRRYPKVDFNAAPLYVDNGRILTSAGASAGFDLCLYLVRRDYGAAAAARSARLAVMSLERHGNQAQFLVGGPPTSGAGLGPVLEWMEKNFSRSLSLQAMAKKAGMSTRTFRRRFHEQTQQTPQRWLRRVRLHRAQELLEGTGLSIEAIAEKSGLGSAAILREHFWKEFRTTPTAYRQSFATH